MKRGVSMVLWAAIAAGVPAYAAEPEPVASKIDRVTVYSDRARVTRTAAAEVGQKAMEYVFEKLPGWVDDGSVRVSTSFGRITDVRARRDYLARATDQEYLQAAGAVESLVQKLGALQDEVAVLDAQMKQIEAIKAFSLEKISKESAVRDVSVESYRQVLQFISGSLRETAKARRAVHVEMGKLTPELEAGRRKLAELQSLTQLEETAVVVTVQGDSSGRATLELTYMLPGATWEPTHDLRVSGPTPRNAEVASYAVVTQTSGEDWEGAEVTFSTQSSTEAVRIPDLEALRLGDMPSARRIVATQAETFSRAKQAFEGQNQLYNKMRQKTTTIRNFEEVYETNFHQLQIVQSKTVEIFTALQNRGTTAHFKSAGRATIRGDGHPVRLPIGKAVLEATQRIVAAPEDSLNAARTLQMTNSGAQPLLPGKVALYHDGAFLGMTSMDFVADGEKFAMFLSVADQLKLGRALDKQHSSLVKKKTNRMQLAFLVTVENLSGEPVTLDLADRVPVSENKEIEVDEVEIDPAVQPDSSGILRWAVSLGPKEKRTFRISYRVEYPPTLVLQTEHAPAGMPSAAPASRSMKLDLEQQIQHYENEL